MERQDQKLTLTSITGAFIFFPFPLFTCTFKFLSLFILESFTSFGIAQISSRENKYVDMHIEAHRFSYHVECITHSVEEGVNLSNVKIALFMKTQFLNPYYCTRFLSSFRHMNYLKVQVKFDILRRAGKM